MKIKFSNAGFKFIAWIFFESVYFCRFLYLFYFRNVSHSIKNRVMKWFEYYFHQNNLELDEEVCLLMINNFLQCIIYANLQEFYRALPHHLAVELAAEIHTNILKQIPVFKECEPEVIGEIALRIRKLKKLQASLISLLIRHP